MYYCSQFKKTRTAVRLCLPSYQHVPQVGFLFVKGYRYREVFFLSSTISTTENNANQFHGIRASYVGLIADWLIFFFD